MQNVFLPFMGEVFLFFSSEMQFLILGYLALRGRSTKELLYISALSGLWVYALKVTFQIPLTFTQESFAFPSGHTHGSTVFYTWLALQGPGWQKWATPFLLVGIAASLVGFGYHGWVDIMGAVTSSGVLLTLFLATPPVFRPWLALGGSTCLLVYSHCIYGLSVYPWKLYGALWMVFLAQHVLGSQSFKHYAQNLVSKMPWLMAQARRLGPRGKA